MPPSASDLRPLFLLDPTVTFLNHGSFGACPKPVFETYQNWQLELERQPVEFLGRRVESLLETAMQPLAEYVNADAEDMVFVPNATTGVNLVARSLPLQTGDEILATDHEYGACKNIWDFVCKNTGAKYVEVEVPLPLEEATFVEQIWAAVTPRTRVLFLSHITSPTALIFPIAELVRRARAAGIYTVIDGAHAPGHIPLDMRALDADFYTGNCHKWLCAPKGSAFLYVRREHQSFVQPGVISWGYGLSFQEHHRMQATRDPAAYLSVPAAIAFQNEHQWDTIRPRCHTLAAQMLRDFTALTELDPLSDDSGFGQMVTIPLPSCDDKALKQRLYDDYRIEVPTMTWRDRQYFRVSFQGYNTPEDGDHLRAALTEVIFGNH